MTTRPDLVTLLGASVYVCACPGCMREELNVIKVNLPARAKCSGTCGEAKPGTFIICRPCGIALCMACLTEGDGPANAQN